MSTTDSPDSGNYEVLKRRLEDLATELQNQATALNTQRQATFGGSEMAIIGSERLRTENNCVPVDIAALGEHVVVGYKVFLGLRTEFEVSDVFGLYHYASTAEGFEFQQVDPATVDPGLFGSEVFNREFDELRKYYKDARLIQMRAASKLLAVFQVGETYRDVRVLRWSLTPEGLATYIDNRGERDHVYPPSHSFDWIRTTRDDHRRGRYPHISIRDKVFVETTGGDLTIKIEDNTETGLGIYAEVVEDKNQSLDDAEISFAEVGVLILLKMKPFREEKTRYLVYNTRARQAVRIDAIGQSCIALPEDQGILFPGGFYLQTGEYKLFDVDTKQLEFKRQFRSPNGEDVLYVFHQRTHGHYLLFPYNLIRREVATPIPCDGFTIFEDGKMVALKHTNDEPSRVHPVQIWQTPFYSQEFASRTKSDGSFFGRIGNADLVRGLSDCFAVVARIRNQSPTRERYEDLIAHVNRMFDAHHWVEKADAAVLGATLKLVRKNTEQIVDEFEKVLAFRARAEAQLAEAKTRLATLEKDLDVVHWKEADRFMRAMDALRGYRGHVAMLREVRSMDVEALEALDKTATAHFTRVAGAAVTFLNQPKSLEPLTARLAETMTAIGLKATGRELKELGEELDTQSRGLEVLTETVASLPVDDPTLKTAILDGLSEVFGQLNRVRAEYQNRRKELAFVEDKAEFSAQFRLLGQAVSSAVALSDTPEACDGALARLMVQIEELDSRFAESDEFTNELSLKREEVHEALTSRKQALVDARQRRIQNLLSAGERILEGIARRIRNFKDETELNAYFAADAMLLRLRQIAVDLEALGDTVKSGELLGKLKTAQQTGLRGLRDKLELFDGDDNAVRLGEHRFTVNEQPLELTIIPRDDAVYMHISGTDFYEPIPDSGGPELRALMAQSLPSETADIYRSEFLAASLLLDSELGHGPLDLRAPDTWNTKDLQALVQKTAGERYQEGYERGVHDDDATRILEALLRMRQTAGLLRHRAHVRSLAVLFAAHTLNTEEFPRWQGRAKSLSELRITQPMAAKDALATLEGDLARALVAFIADRGLAWWNEGAAHQAATYLVDELAAAKLAFVTAHDALALATAATSARPALRAELQQLTAQPAAALGLAHAWAQAAATKDPALAPFALEAAVCLVTADAVPRESLKATLALTLEGLSGQHARIRERRLDIRLDEVLGRVAEYRRVGLVRWQEHRRHLHGLIEARKTELRLDGFKPRVLTSFVRNRLLNEVYLPYIGANLAKQIGAAGAARRTDLMGLLLLISPPGYGKTTLMEYVASRLGFAFIKVNGPSLGHSVTSLDPAEAPNATARQEIMKLNLALEMGNNVMLLIDDIQHTHPEFLQKFISLCDGTRRIDGVWGGGAKTFDLRGKKFCVVMAGNPYTESGESFQIPDMLANRADIYDLGQILDGKREAFVLSYLENSLTSNPTLAPLATRSQADVYKLVRMAAGEPIASTDLEYGYSAAEIGEILGVLKHLARVQEILLAVNQSYIDSAAMADAYRTEPPFKLQGSYRNMNKLAEKVVAALTLDELERVVDTHYAGEARTLTTGSEANLLKLGELRGRMTPSETKRWAEIKAEFVRRNQLGGAEEDPATRVTSQLSLMQRALREIETAIVKSTSKAEGDSDLKTALASLGDRLDAHLKAIATRLTPTKATAPSQAPTPTPTIDLSAVTTALDAIARGLQNRPIAVPPPVPAKRTLANAQAPEALTAAPDFQRFLNDQGRLVDEAIVPMARAASKNLEENTHLTRELLNLISRLEGAGYSRTP